jgi:hypothetical protein
MAYTERGRRTRYDNIAAGSAVSSKENTINGNTVSVVEVYGGGTMTSTSNEERDITNISVGTVSTSDAAFQGPDNAGVAVDPTDERLG